MATGILRRPPLGSLLLFIFSTAFVFSLLIITNSFIYRYVHLCKIDHAYIYTTRKWVLVVVSINVLIVVNWIFMLLFGRSRDVAFRHEMNSVARAEAGIDLDETAFIGFSVQMNAFPLILLCENLILMFGLLLIMCFCAIQITLTLKKATLSKNAKKHHRQMFTLLLLQTASPALFMYAPLGLMYVMLFSGTSSSVTMSTVTATLFSIFPAVDPVILIAFLREYREYVLRTVRLRRRERTVSPTSHHTTAPHHPTARDT